MKRLFFLVVLFVFSQFVLLHAESLTLEKAVKLALERNPTFKSAYYSVLSAQEKEKEAWANKFFTLSFRYSYTRLNEEQQVKIKPVTIPPLFPGMSPVTIKPKDMITSKQNVYQYQFSFYQPIFMGGALSESHKIARIGVDVERLREEEAKLDLIFRVKAAYYTALKAKSILDVARKTVKRLEAHYKDAKNFFEAGITPRVDLLRAEVALNRAKHALVEAEANYKIAISALLILLREPVDKEVKLEGKLEFRPWGLDFKRCLEKALFKRPVVIAVNKQIEMAKGRIKIEKAEYFPKIFIAAQYKKHGDTPKCTGDDITDAEQWSITSVFDWKFFEWGKTRHRVKRAEYEYMKVLEMKKEIEDRISLEVREAYLKLISAKERIPVALKEMEEAKENLKDTRERYKEQVDTTTDVIDAETFLTKAEVDYYTALCDYLIAYARLKRVMGEVE